MQDPQLILLFDRLASVPPSAYLKATRPGVPESLIATPLYFDKMIVVPYVAIGWLKNVAQVPHGNAFSLHTFQKWVVWSVGLCYPVWSEANSATNHAGITFVDRAYAGCMILELMSASVL